MAAMAALQSSMATLSLSSSNSFFGQRLSLPSLSLPQSLDRSFCMVYIQVKSPEKPCLIVMKKPIFDTCSSLLQLKRWERKECKENSLPVLHKMHVKVGDTIQVIAGDDKGKIGEITKIFRHNSTVVVKEINLKTKHVKSREEGEPGQIIKFWRLKLYVAESDSVVLYKITLSSSFSLFVL
ncbi:hypothetical protein NC652_004235 [Populus alba x Populus x berolinensis]|nr:hypothetical protein NC652_004235 [Populus alba x Populus x berolinensis]